MLSNTKKLYRGRFTFLPGERRQCRIWRGRRYFNNLKRIEKYFISRRQYLNIWDFRLILDFSLQVFSDPGPLAHKLFLSVKWCWNGWITINITLMMLQGTCFKMTTI